MDRKCQSFFVFVFSFSVIRTLMLKPHGTGGGVLAPWLCKGSHLWATLGSYLVLREGESMGSGNKHSWG